jgi:hypothetical protein
MMHGKERSRAQVGWAGMAIALSEAS